MDFICICIFVGLFYIRPWEWNSFAANLGPVTKVMAIGLAVMLYKKFENNDLRPRSLIRTPVDWAMVAFVFWLCYSNADWRGAWDQINPRLGYFALTAHALSSWKRIEKFLWVWMSMIVIICVLGALAYYGIYDPFGSHTKINGVWKGRCGLNLAVFANPNAFGHSVVPVIPMIYYLGIFRRFIVVREIGAPLFIAPALALYLTESKGSFLSAGVTAVATAAFGRPKAVQAAILLFAYGSGMSIMLLLPRMGVIKNPKSDAGIRGRIKAQEFGWKVFQTNPNGVGYGNFRNVHFAEVADERALAIKEATYRHQQMQARRETLIRKWQSEIGRVERDKHLSDEHRQREVQRRKAWIEGVRIEKQKRQYQFDRIDWHEKEEYKAVTSHNSYVEVGTELGKKGLYLWLGVIYFCLKSLVLAKCQTDQQERIRRLMFGVISSYLCSSWATNISYRATFFLQCGTVSAFHYLLHNPASATEASPALAATPDEGTATPAQSSSPQSDQTDQPKAEEATKRTTMQLLRPLVLDLIFIYIFFSLVVRGWKHIVFDL